MNVGVNFLIEVAVVVKHLSQDDVFFSLHGFFPPYFNMRTVAFFNTQL